ncbi:hypothetical protein D8B26_004469 [Coccidioides posadasii str. Silveira]|uniref:Efficient mitochondria targeting-associated protein 19 n=2 Tax=Coccidioides posadasii TaxID=199306 RepID=E9DEY8_COCPS|nr:conserved hypothetical protein [Coccidioides posadasii str. Silveira]KMM69010.1 hypothetical protein CPAG_05333 [Coccidioides posadasii RMSCC 3488]QVM09809.1 hypothetical protein D8B26_004469 [Coccidioides posadasii str. Silveira]
MSLRSDAGQSKLAKTQRQNAADVLYIAFFAIHLVVMFAVDLVPLYPDSIRPAALDTLRDFYIDKYHDKFFSEPPQWFRAYILMEAFYHVPASILIIRGFLKEDAFVSVHLLVWAVQASLTTLTCLVDVWDWTDRTFEEKSSLTLLYGPYLAFSVLAGLDMFCRLRRTFGKSKRD